MSEDGGFVLMQAQEFHTSIWGHMGLIGLSDHYLLPDYVGYAQTPLESLYPDNTTVADLAHDQGALVGYVHPFDTAPDPAGNARVSHALPVDVALGKVDYLEVVGFSDHLTTAGVWYRLLNCGFRIPAAGATDAMSNYASLRGPVGMNRTYVKAADDGDAAARMRAWLDGLKAGRSFATNSPLLSLEIEGEGPGGDIALNKGLRRLKYTAAMRSIAPVDRVELVVNGEVAATLPISDDGRSAEGKGEIEVSASGWAVLRAVSDHASPLIFDGYPYGTTSPVYLTMKGSPARSREDADYFMAWIDRLIAYAQDSDGWNNDAERETVLAHFTQARRKFENRR